MPTRLHTSHHARLLHAPRALGSLALLLAPIACDPGDELGADEEEDKWDHITGDCGCGEGVDQTDRSNFARRGGAGDGRGEVVFDGAQVRAEVAADPDARFVVDLRGSDRVRFVQDEVGLDFAHFLVLSAAMPRPIPMREFADLFGLDLDLVEFTLQSAAAEDSVFRVTRSDLLECIEACVGEDEDGCVAQCG